jgi:hypothetical protein
VVLREAALPQSRSFPALLAVRLSALGGLPPAFGLPALARLVVVTEESAQQPLPVALVPVLVAVGGASVPPSLAVSRLPPGTGRRPLLTALLSLASLAETVLPSPLLALPLLPEAVAGSPALALVLLSEPLRSVPLAFLFSVLPSLFPTAGPARFVVVGSIPLVPFLVSMVWHGRRCGPRNRRPVRSQR